MKCYFAFTLSVHACLSVCKPEEDNPHVNVFIICQCAFIKKLHPTEIFEPVMFNTKGESKVLMTRNLLNRRGKGGSLFSVFI